MTVHNSTDALTAEMLTIGAAAREAARAMREASDEAKTKALMVAAATIRSRAAEILAANKDDVEAAKAAGLPGNMIDRLALNDARIEAMAKGIEIVAALPDPVGREQARWSRPNGLDIARVATPIGVIGIVYESRPNVTADAGALTLKSGNAAILRGGSDSLRTSRPLAARLSTACRKAGLPGDAIQLVPTRDRDAVGAMLTGLDGNIDVIVPRGGKGLVARVQAETRVPVFAHLEGVCHVYVDKAASLDMAKTIVLNAKMRRVGVCGAAETLLVDRACAPTHLKPLVDMLLDAGCEIRGDKAVQAADSRVKPAAEDDWGTEFLDAIIAAKVVDGVD